MVWDCRWVNLLPLIDIILCSYIELIFRGGVSCLPAALLLHVTPKLISAFVFTTRIVQLLYFLNPKYLGSNNLLRLYNPVCYGLGKKPPRRPVFSQRGSDDSIRMMMFSHDVSRMSPVIIFFFALFVQQRHRVARFSYAVLCLISGFFEPYIESIVSDVLFLYQKASLSVSSLLTVQAGKNGLPGGPRGRVGKVAEFQRT